MPCVFLDMLSGRQGPDIQHGVWDLMKDATPDLRGRLVDGCHRIVTGAPRQSHRALG
jgi:hypothetical protein